MISLKEMYDGFKSAATAISRIVKLEERVTILEKRISDLKVLPPDIKDGLVYKQEWHCYVDSKTGENFCPVCIGNGKRIAVKRRRNYDGIEGYDCLNCKAYYWAH